MLPGNDRSAQQKNSVFWEARGSVVVKALCYEPEGRGFETRWGKFFQLT
jgi:hypothetical protein